MEFLTLASGDYSGEKLFIVFCDFDGKLSTCHSKQPKYGYFSIRNPPIISQVDEFSNIPIFILTVFPMIHTQLLVPRYQNHFKISVIKIYSIRYSTLNKKHPHILQSNFQMKKAQLLTRTLGRHLTFPSTSLAHLLTRKNDILEAINRHGCICIKNVDFREKEMVQFTKGIWDQVIELPGFLCFNNRDEIYRQVARVGNIKLDGTLKDSQKEANYWHQDGEFWGEGKKHIYNCLHTREEPEKGGQTHIMDLVKGAQFLRQKKPEMFRKLQNLIGQVNIEQIYDFKLYNAKNILNIEGTTRHKLVVHDPKTNTQRLFLSVLELLDPATMKQSKELGIQEVLETLQNEMGFYAHKWEQGDLVIWDNLQVMHRSSGSFEGRRLLFRTQGRFNN